MNEKMTQGLDQPQSRTTIRDDLERALSSEDDFTSSFFSKVSYPQAPRFGAVYSDGKAMQLPLNAQAVQRFKRYSAQTDPDVAKWELAAEAVSFADSSWTEFLKDAVREACGTLGVDFGAVAPRAEPEKFVMLGKDASLTVSNAGAETDRDVFARLFVLLPSTSTGSNSVTLSYGNKDVSWDCPWNKALETTIISCYNDVTFELQPLTGGHALVLSYNLFRSQGRPLPSPPSYNSVINRLSAIFSAWEEDNGESTPEKMVYLLDETDTRILDPGDSHDIFDPAFLTPTEMVKIFVLKVAARQRGFGLGFADIRLEEWGMGRDDQEDSEDEFEGSREGQEQEDEANKMNVDEDAENNENGANPDFEDDAADRPATGLLWEKGYPKMAVDIREFVDTSGLSLDGYLGLPPRRSIRAKETIPKHLIRAMESGPAHDSDDYDSLDSYSLKRYFDRKLLVIWPSWNVYLTYGGWVGLGKACDALSNESPDPSVGGKALAQWVLKEGDGTRRVTHALCGAACRWKNVKLWNDAIADYVKHKDFALESDGDELVFSAISSFEFALLRSSFELMMLNEKIILKRAQFLARLKIWIKSTEMQSPSAADHEDLQAWIIQRHAEILIASKNTLTIPSNRALALELHAQREHFPLPADYNGSSLQDTISSLARMYASDVKLTDKPAILAALQFCASVDRASLCTGMLHTACTTAHLSKTLLPLIPEIHLWAVAHGALDAITPVVQRIVSEWMDKELGDPPVPDAVLDRAVVKLADWTCACEACAAARTFLMDDPDESVELKEIGAPVRKHVERELLAHGQELAGFQTVYTVPHGLLIQKKEPLYKFTKWKGEKAKGNTVLSSIETDEDSLRQLLGPVYDRAVAALKSTDRASDSDEPPAKRQRR